MRIPDGSTDLVSSHHRSWLHGSIIAYSQYHSMASQSLPELRKDQSDKAP